MFVNFFGNGGNCWKMMKMVNIYGKWLKMVKIVYMIENDWKLLENDEKGGK